MQSPPPNRASIDDLYVDTAGRLHTKTGLMDELDKMRRTAARLVPGAPHEVLLVMDATTGQNGLQQARLFTQSAGVTGIVLTKLDGTAKGGIAVAIARELNPSRPLRRRRRKNDRPAGVLAGRICGFTFGIAFCEIVGSERVGTMQKKMELKNQILLVNVCIFAALALEYFRGAPMLALAVSAIFLFLLVNVIFYVRLKKAKKQS